MLHYAGTLRAAGTGAGDARNADRCQAHSQASLVSTTTPNVCRFEQAFSDDGGKTWEVNWIATDTRM
jgi:hypothetical protein